MKGLLDSLRELAFGLLPGLAISFIGSGVFRHVCAYSVLLIQSEARPRKQESPLTEYEGSP